MTLDDGLAPTIVEAGDGPVLHAFGDTFQVKLGAEQTGGRLALGLATVPPGSGPPPHLHRNEDELFIVVEGRMSFLANGAWTDVAPGGVVFLPRGAPHTFKNRTDAPVKMWIIATPSGFERFFGRCAEVFTSAAGAGGPDMARIMRIAGEHGIEFVEQA